MKALILTVRCLWCRREAMLFALVLVAAACAPDSRLQARQEVEPGATLSGNYLAARHAEVANDAAAAVDFLRAALDIDPDEPALIARAYAALVIAGQTADAVPLARKFLDGKNDAALARLILAADDLRAAHFAAAAQHLAPFPAEGGLGYIARVLTAWALAGENHTDEALAGLDPAGNANGVAMLYRLHAAWIDDLANRSAAAEAQLQPVFDQHEQPWLRLTELAAGVLARAGKPDKAAALYRSYLERVPQAHGIAGQIERLDRRVVPPRIIRSAKDGAAEALFDAAGIARRQNADESALILGQLGLYIRPDFPELRMVVADLMEDAGRYADANAIYAEIDRSSPLAESAELGTARNLDRLDRFDDSVRMLEDLARKHPDDPEPLSELGDLLRRHERFEDAVKAYDRAFARIGELKPYHWRLLYARGIALERAKNWDRAEADFLKALAFEPEQPFVLNYLGYSWVEQGRNLAQAEEMIRKAVALRPQDGYIVDSLGWVLYRLGRYPEAVVALERAVELKSEDPVMNDHLGDAYWAAGRQREARYQWRTALALSPEAELKAQLEDKLQRGLVRQANAVQP